MIKNPIIKFAVLNVHNTILFDHFIRYLHKFNIKSILIIKYKRAKINLNILRYYQINFDIVSAIDKDDLLNNLFYFRKKLPKIFFNFDTSFFLNQNLFKFKNKFKKKNKKLLYFLNKSYYFKFNLFRKSELNFYKKIQKENFPKSKLLKVDISKNQFFCLKKNKNKNQILKFFRKINSKSVILDRDGVINKDFGYISNIKKLDWINGFTKAIKFFNDNNYNIFVASNQSGIARGYFKEQDVFNIHSYIKDYLQLKDLYINQIYFCPYFKEGTIKKYQIDSYLRKPKIGMYLQIKKNWLISNKNTKMIGDRNSDILFAKNAGIKGLLFKQNNLFNFVKKYF